MPKISPVVVSLILIWSLAGCSKKTNPTVTASPAVEVKDSVAVIKKSDSATVTKAAVKKKPKEQVPKVIAVNDKAASRSVDGRYYYDLQGHRYWRNNKDGKYYLYNKSMNTDEAFKKPN